MHVFLIELGETVIDLSRQLRILIQVREMWHFLVFELMVEQILLLLFFGKLTFLFVFCSLFGEPFFPRLFNIGDSLLSFFHLLNYFACVT